MNDKKIVLVVGMGTSPAVMTETVWALAHQSEPVVPDEIAIEKMLMWRKWYNMSISTEAVPYDN